MSPASAPAHEASIVLPLPRLARPAPEQADTGGRALSLEQVSSLLWHGIGFSRHVRGRAALPRRLHPELQVYVLLPDGAYRYDPHEHRLQLVVPSDLRPLADGAGAREAALHLLYVTEERPRAEEEWEECGRLALEDVDRIAAHLGARCAEQGLVCGASHRVPARLRVALRLHPAQHARWCSGSSGRRTRPADSEGSEAGQEPVQRVQPGTQGRAPDGPRAVGRT